MTIDRREFLKSSAAVMGAAAMAGTVATRAAAAPAYEVYALKYAGPFTSKLAFLLWGQGWDQDIDRYYYLWALKGPDETILVDTGAGVTLAAQRKLTGYVNPVDVLARIGVKGPDVTKVVISHMHFDHVGGVEMFPDTFPKAKFYVQKKEFDFWISSPIAKRKMFAGTADPLANKALAALQGTERLVKANGDRTIAPGVEALLAPGHTIALQSVAVNTAQGTAIVASDCAHLARNIKEDTPSILITDLIGWMGSYDKLRAKASSIDLIFPGHDAGLLMSYPKVADDVTRLA
jgi:glyoxylase-like metal-dependent hydrolase (beta-lactamase superfamily II)